MPGQYRLEWSNHLSNISSAFTALQRNNKLVDVTLAADGRSLEAHKVVLSACSTYFEELLSSNPCKHPIIYLKDVAFEHLCVIIEFVYNGSVHISKDCLDEVLKVGSSLRIRGMTEAKTSGRQASNDENQDPEAHLTAPKKRKRPPNVSRDNSIDDPDTPDEEKLTIDSSGTPARSDSPGPVQVLDILPTIKTEVASPGRLQVVTSQHHHHHHHHHQGAVSPSPDVSEPHTSAAAPPHKATVMTAAERKAAPPRSYSEDSATPRAKRGRLLQRQTRVKRDSDQPSGGRESEGEGEVTAPRSRSPSPCTLASSSVEAVISDVPPGGSYLTVPASGMPPRQMSAPTPVLSTREGTLVKQDSMPVSIGHAVIQKSARSTSVLSRCDSGPAFFVVANTTAAPMVPMVMGTSQAVPRILLTSGPSPHDHRQQAEGGVVWAVDYHPPAGPGLASPPPRKPPTRLLYHQPEEISGGGSTPRVLKAVSAPTMDSGASLDSVPGSAHAPVLREGPAVSCSHCWNTEYSQGRTIRRKTKYMCKDCAVSLCIVPCFQEYHEARVKMGASRDPSRVGGSKKPLPKLSSV